MFSGGELYKINDGFLFSLAIMIGVSFGAGVVVGWVIWARADVSALRADLVEMTRQRDWQIEANAVLASKLLNARTENE